jgi:VanZ family protein
MRDGRVIEWMRKASRILVFVVAAAILLASLLPRAPLRLERIRFADKISHALAYLVWGFLLFLSQQTGRPRRRALLAVLVCLLFGGAIEVLQGFTGRSPELADLLADGLGAAVGTGAAGAALRRMDRRE